MQKILSTVFIVIILGVVLYIQQDKKFIPDPAKLVQIVDDCSFTEGPAVDQAGNVYFTDQPNNRIMKWSVDGSVSLFMDSCGRSNGLYFDNHGKLYACADEHNQLWRIDPETKAVEVLIDGFEGTRLNGPNDLWIDNRGGIYFTDPFYKREYWSDQDREAVNENLYYRTPEGEVLLADDDLVKPNGLVGTSEGRILYVSDIGADKTYSYHISDDGELTNRRVFCKMGSDGMTIDNKGNVYLTNKGVSIFNLKGEPIAHIDINQAWTANVTFGGPERNILFITAMNAVYTLPLEVRGVR
ncbi:MAG: SMP-30/gluconolactonase/LRE family protein [Prolixibacteraceae bacterium]|nr:SMP-30/gluconolactonase/LRE family protein [Prolixibacteraceae bacterium]